jgi:hypothetical protein
MLTSVPLVHSPEESVWRAADRPPFSRDRRVSATELFKFDNSSGKPGNFGPDGSPGGGFCTGGSGTGAETVIVFLQ